MKNLLLRDSSKWKDYITTYPSVWSPLRSSCSLSPGSATNGSKVRSLSMSGWTKRGMASSRMNFFGMSIFYPVFLAWGYTRPLPRKLYTDMVADTGLDGAYVRESLRTYKPGLWSKISSQLHKLNFNFPEMHEFKGTTFPSNFVSSRTVWIPWFLLKIRYFQYLHFFIRILYIASRLNFRKYSSNSRRKSNLY